MISSTRSRMDHAPSIPPRCLRAYAPICMTANLPGYISTKFHNSIAAMIVAVCLRLKERYRLDSVALSGGCFQNGYLLSQCISGLSESGFTVLHHQVVPPNDGGIALGQALIAHEYLTKSEG